MAVEVMRMMASRGLSIRGSGTSCTRRSSAPFQQLAFMRLDPPAVRFAPPAAWLGGWNAPGGWFALGDGNPRLAAATAGPPVAAVREDCVGRKAGPWSLEFHPFRLTV